MTNQEQRRIFKKFHRERDEILKLLLENVGYANVNQLPHFPEECIGMTCGAKTRAGNECKRKDLHKNGRCRLHGGLSTGPKTLDGKRKSALNTGKTYEQLIEEKL